MGWYEHELEWPTAGGPPPALVTGMRFDALDAPAEAGFAMLSRFSRPDLLGPVALDGHRVRLLVAAGTAEELPGLLEWLQWGGIELDLRALGAGQTLRAPAHPEWDRREAAYDRSAPVWLRPPRPGFDVESTVPALRVAREADETGVPVGLTVLVAALATACHRVALRARCPDQPWAFSYASRMVAGTRPRSLTS
ncbi:SCO3374 family protein [Actinacidiphila reveromycinica]|uniref:SCO3374 family protein n=1 Tax=Actinacidiphila reveromycinica TaxID=659352 RepID=UPI001920DC28|nr:SCO3374 family protein [Streptomyces sp. SN-593]